MRKLYTLALALICAASVFAQKDETFAFVDKDGNIIADGTELTITDVELDEMTGELLCNSGLFIKNVSSGNANVGITVEVVKIDNGNFQVCFPSMCMATDKAGTITPKEARGMAPEDQASIQSEWKPVADGACKAIYTIRRMELEKPMPPTYKEVAKGATVTVTFLNGAAKIGGVAQGNAQALEAQSFNLNGQAVGSQYKGVIVKGGKKILK